MFTLCQRLVSKVSERYAPTSLTNRFRSLSVETMSQADGNPEMEVEQHGDQPPDDVPDAEMSEESEHIDFAELSDMTVDQKLNIMSQLFDRKITRLASKQDAQLTFINTQLVQIQQVLAGGNPAQGPKASAKDLMAFGHKPEVWDKYKERKNPDINEYLKSIQILLENMRSNLEPPQLCYVASTFFDANIVFRWHDKAATVPAGSSFDIYWHEFVAMIHSYYPPKDPKYLLVDKLTDVSMVDGAKLWFAAYVEQYQSIREQLRAVGDDTLLELVIQDFERRLPSAYQNLVDRRKPTGAPWSTITEYIEAVSSKVRAKGLPADPTDKAASSFDRLGEPRQGGKSTDRSIGSGHNNHKNKLLAQKLLAAHNAGVAKAAGNPRPSRSVPVPRNTAGVSGAGPSNQSTGCNVCGKSNHTAESCHFNPKGSDFRPDKVIALARQQTQHNAGAKHASKSHK